MRKRELTYSRTLKKSNKEVPKAFLADKSCEVASSIYGLANDITLRAQEKQSHSADFKHATTMEISKSEVIGFYNTTMGCANYSTNRRRR